MRLGIIAPLGTHECFIGFLIEHYAGNFLRWLAPDQVRVITPNNDEALIDYAKPLVAEPRANIVRVGAHFSATPFKARFPTRSNCASTRCSSSAAATSRRAR